MVRRNARGEESEAGVGGKGNLRQTLGRALGFARVQRAGRIWCIERPSVRRGVWVTYIRRNGN